MRLIDVSEYSLKGAEIHWIEHDYNAINVHRKPLYEIPTVDAAPVVHGQWIHCEGKSSIWYCSVCGDKIIYNPTRKTYKPDKKPVWEINKYCRNCGALMDAGGEDEST